MNTLLHFGVVIAQGNRLDSLSSGFRGRRAQIDSQDFIVGALVLAVIVLVVWGLSYLMQQQERRRAVSRPRLLFLELCRKHRLKLSQWWLLWRLARAGGLRDPARLFLEPQHFDAAQLSGPLRAQAEQVRQLRKALFGELEAERAA
jgi:hypothetical protein